MSIRWLIVCWVIMPCFLSSCEGSSSSESIDEPAKVENIKGSDLHRVTLTEDAKKRIDLRMVPVEDRLVNGKQFKLVPYSAVLYDENGNTWVYTLLKPLTFVREKINIDSIDGDLVLLSAGPSTGTQIVTVGASELYGAEFLGSIEP